MTDPVRSIIPDRDRRDILAAVKAKHASALSAAKAAEADGNNPSEEFWLGRAEKLYQWIQILEEPIP